MSRVMYSPYNPCCAGSFYGTGCTADCPSQQPVPRTSGDLGGFLALNGWQQFVPAIEPAPVPTADAIAWEAYSRAWADSMSGIVSFCGGNQRVARYEPPAPLDWSE